MDTNEFKNCPYCGKTIRWEAIKCRYCGCRLDMKSPNLDWFRVPGYWHRVNEGKKIAGVCTGIAAQFDSPLILMPLRVFFVLSTVFAGIGLLIYLILWLFMPEPLDVKIPGKTYAEKEAAVSETGAPVGCRS